MEPSVFIRHNENENTHWWFSARRKILSYIIKKKVEKLGSKLRILDYGAGSGTNVHMLSKFGKVFVYEKNKDAQNYLKKKFTNNENIDILENFDKEMNFDLIVAADVIEHVEKDDELLKQLEEQLSEKGKILITVPAYKFLFSEKDRVLQHYRRYNFKEIKFLGEKYFKIKKLSYFNFFLFFPISISILYLKLFNIKFIKYAETTPNFFLNKILYKIFSFEMFFLSFINFPFGISILLLGEKKQ